MPIPEHIIEKVKEENDIVDVISDVVRLKRTGKNYSGLCPFHHEKTPSFSVSQDKQIFKCFGCGETGNVISFVMKNKSMTLPEAVGYLADRANITLEFEDKKLSVIQKKKENIYTGSTPVSYTTLSAYMKENGSYTDKCLFNVGNYVRLCEPHECERNLSTFFITFSHISHGILLISLRIFCLSCSSCLLHHFD